MNIIIRYWYLISASLAMLHFITALMCLMLAPITDTPFRFIMLGVCLGITGLVFAAGFPRDWHKRSLQMRTEREADITKKRAKEITQEQSDLSQRIELAEIVIEQCEKWLSEEQPHACPDYALRAQYRDRARKAIAKYRECFPGKSSK